MIQETSRQAYRNDVRPTLGDRHKRVIEALQGEQGLTNNELADKLGWPINTVTPRIFELRNKYQVEEAGKRLDRITGRKAIAWRLTRKQASIFDYAQ